MNLLERSESVEIFNNSGKITPLDAACKLSFRSSRPAEILVLAGASSNVSIDNFYKLLKM